ncbi:35804_t:CDS:2, partial [Gigaspora margarita]
RLTATNEERDYLIATGLIPTNLQSRPISLVSARSIFMLFGSKIIQDGIKFYDPHTNTEQVTRDIQPTRIRTEMISLTRNNAIIEPEI